MAVVGHVRAAATRRVAVQPGGGGWAPRRAGQLSRRIPAGRAPARGDGGRLPGGEKLLAWVGRNGRPAPIPPGCNEDFTAKWIHCCRLCMVTKEYCQL